MLYLSLSNLYVQNINTDTNVNYENALIIHLLHFEIIDQKRNSLLSIKLKLRLKLHVKYNTYNNDCKKLRRVSIRVIIKMSKLLYT